MPPTSTTINRNKKRVLRELLNFNRPKEFKTIAGFKKIFSTNNALQTYRLMDELVGMTTITSGFVNDAPTLDLDALKSRLFRYRGQRVMVKYILDLPNTAPISYDEWVAGKSNKLKKFNLQGGEIKYKEYQIPSFNNFEDFDIWWNNERVKWDWQIDSEEDIFTFHDNQGKLYFYPSNNSLINYNRIRQSYLDGVEHCVFTPIYEWAERKYNDETISPSTRKKYNAIMNKINKKFLKKYKNGVPEIEMENVCKDLNIRIEIHYPYCEEYKIYGSTLIKPRKIFEYINIRLNHLEQGKMYFNSHITEVQSIDEMRTIEEELIDSNTDYCFIQNIDGHKTMIQTISTRYMLVDDFMKNMKELEEKYNMNEMKICDIRNPELSNFILNGTHYNQHLCAINDNKNMNMKMIDMKKAYFNFKQSPHYNGFLGKITDFRKTEKIHGVGLYYISDINFSNCLKKFVDINSLMCIYKKKNVYTSVELEYLKKFGVDYKIKYGCWGIKTLDFEFGEEFLEKLNKKPFVNEDGDLEWNGISHYAKATGYWDRHNLITKIKFYGDEDYAKVLQENTTNQITHYWDGTITMDIQKKKNEHLGHITSFILAYQRLGVLDQLLEMDLSLVHFINVDGIFYDNHDFKLNPLFREKEIDGWESKIPVSNKYITRQDEYCKCDFINKKDRPHYNIEVFKGAGGCGKTHINLMDNGLVNLLYVAPSNKLCASKKNDYKIDCKTLSLILYSKNPEIIKNIKKKYNVLLIDECSMVSNEEKDNVIKTYDNMKIIFCGDFNYQLPCIEGTEFNFDRVDNITTLTQNYRCTCEKLYKLLKFIRECIDKNDSVLRVYNQILQLNNNMIKKEDVYDLYDINDMLLTYTNTEWKEYTELLKDKGNKYMVVENNKFHNNGDIVFEIPKAKHEIRHAFTTHSIQGETASNKLFLELANMNDIRLLYTAISRAKKLEQIYFIF